MSIPALVKRGSLSPEGLKCLERIVQEAVNRNGGVRALAAKANSLQDSADTLNLGGIEQLCLMSDRISKDTVHRLCHIAAGDGSSNLLLKLKFLAPYTFNPETCQPFAFEDLLAIARGERQVVWPKPNEGGGQLGFFRDRPASSGVAVAEVAIGQEDSGVQVVERQAAVSTIKPSCRVQRYRMEILISLIRIEMEARGISEEAFARSLYLNPKVLHKILSGTLPAKPRNVLQVLSRALINPSTGETFKLADNLAAYCGIEIKKPSNGEPKSQDDNNCANSH